MRRGSLRNRSSISASRCSGVLAAKTRSSVVSTTSFSDIMYTVVRQYTKPNNRSVHRTNVPATASVQRNVVVRAKSGRRTENETHAAYIVNHRRLMRLVHLAPQPPHMNVDEIGLGNELVVPHLFKQHGARQHLLFATHHAFEQTKFARHQIDNTVPALCGALDEIELE